MRFECGWCNVRPKNRGNARARASEVKCGETKSRGPFTKALNARDAPDGNASGAGAVRTGT
jgi:hypothetical protein